MYHNFFIHSSIDGHLGCFHVQSIINTAARITGVHVSFRVVVFSGYMPSSGIAGSYGSLWRRQWQPTPVLLPGNPMGGGAWWAAVHGVAKSWARLSDFIFTFHFLALEKEMATHSSVLAWIIPGMGEPGGLPSMGSHRVGHD